MRLLLITPPMTQLNTPYPATAYLTGFLRQHEARLGLQVAQADAAIELFLRVFSRAGIEKILTELRARAEDTDEDMPDSIASFLAHGDAYVRTIDSVVRFLQGKDPGFALRVVGRDLLPEGPRFGAIGAAWAVLFSGAGSMPMFLHHVRARIGVPLRTYLRAIARPIGASLVMIGVVRLALPDYQLGMPFVTAAGWLAAGVALGVVVYIATIAGLWLQAGRPASACSESIADSMASPGGHR